MSHPYPQLPEGAPQTPYGHPSSQPIPGVPGAPYPQHAQVPPFPQHPQQWQYRRYAGYAGWGQRAGAFLLDCLINFGPMWLLMGVAVVIDDGDTGEDLAVYVSWVGVAYTIVACIVQAVREGRTGQTVGKRAVGIRAIRTYDGLAPGGPLAFARRLCQFLNYPAFCLGWLWASWDDKAQTFADKITSVVVVRADAEFVAPHTQG
ncbi:hypothetical protein SALBM135S_02984 [Streptomyces alboniger]